MAYPFQPPVENAYQVAGRALMQGGEVLGSMRDRIEKLKMALIAQRREEIDAQQKADAFEMQKQLQDQQIASSKAEMENKGKEEARKAREEENKQKFQKAIFEGKQVPTGQQIPAPMQTAQSMEPNLFNRGQTKEMDMIPEMRREDYSKEDLIKLALENDQLTPKDYLEQTRDRTKQLRPTFKQGKDGFVYVLDEETMSWDKTNLEQMPPVSSQPGYMPIVTTNANGQPTTVFVDRRNPNKVVNPELPKPVNQKTISTLKTKLPTIRTARMQIDKLKKSWDAIKGGISAGPVQGEIPTKKGLRFDADVDALRQTIRTLTRTPGEGAMSDYETKLQQLLLPIRSGWEDKTQRNIENLDDLIQLLETGYSEIAKENQYSDQQAQQKQVTEQDIDNMTAEQLKVFLGQND